MFGNFQNAMMDRMFRRVDGLCWDMTTGKMAIATQEGLLTANIDANDPDNSRVEMNLMSDFGMPIPAFAQGTKVEDIKVGDIIINGSSIQGWVIKAEDNKFRLLTPNGSINRWNPPHVTMMGFDSGTLVVRSLLSMVGGSGVQNLQSMMMPMMMSGMIGGDDDGMMDSMMPMLLMMQQGPAAADGSASNMQNMQGMMQTMMLAQMMKKMGGNGNQQQKSFVATINNTQGAQLAPQRNQGNFFERHN